MQKLKSMGWLLIAWPLMVWSMFGFTIGHAREIPFSNNANIHYELTAEPLPRFIENFFSENGFRVVMSTQLKADKRTLNGVREGSPAEIFISILNSNQLISYYDGSLVFIYMAHEIVNRFHPLPTERASGLSVALQRMRLDDSINKTRVDTVANLIEISGVPRYIEQVEQLFAAVVQRDARFLVFRYMPLRHAWASDRGFVIGGRQVTIPGVATVLRQLVQNGGDSQRMFASTDVSMPASAGSVRGQGLAGVGSVQRNAAPRPNKRAPVPPPIPSATQTASTNGLDVLDIEIDDAWGELTDIPEVSPLGDESVARIVADPQRNAVIVRDRVESMPLYEELIRKLDVPSQVIEIEATIIDVNTDKLREAGVDWRYASGTREAINGEPGTKADFLNVIAGDSVAPMSQLPGLQMGAIIGDEDRFVARLNLLQREGFVKVASRPKVVTLNDLEAVLESSRSVYVPVQGAYEVDLFKVFSGTILRVTPHVIEEGLSNQIRLIITAEDGVLDDSTNVNSPSVTRNAVSTQAVIEVDTSLLLGGLERTENITQVRKIPVLGDIPLLGSLFRTERKASQKSERLFLISPRILNIESTQAASAVENKENGLQGTAEASEEPSIAIN